MLKYLRIAVTALCLTACVLLIALWVRNYAYSDFFNWRCADWKELRAQSAEGELSLRLADTDRNWSESRSWYLKSTSRQVREQRRALIGIPVNRPIGPRFLIGADFVMVPHWFVAMLSAITVAIGAAPWLGLRFSLRTLLIAMALAAVGLGIIVSSS